MLVLEFRAIKDWEMDDLGSGQNGIFGMDTILPTLNGVNVLTNGQHIHDQIGKVLKPLITLADAVESATE